MNKPRFQFANIVVVQEEQSGVILKPWGPSSKNFNYRYEIYVRSYNGIEDFNESYIAHFFYSKKLSEEETCFY